MQKIFLSILVNLFASFFVHCSSDGSTSSSINTPEIPKDLYVVSAQLDEIMQDLAHLKSQNSLTFPFKELTIYENRLRDPFEKFISLNQHSDLFNETRIKFCKVAIEFIDFLSDWFLRDPESLFASIKKNSSLSIGNFYELIKEMKGDYPLSPLSLLVSRLIINKINPNDDWEQLTKCFSCLRDVLIHALKIRFFSLNNSFLERIEIFFISKLDNFSRSSETRS